MFLDHWLGRLKRKKADTFTCLSKQLHRVNPFYTAQSQTEWPGELKLATASKAVEGPTSGLKNMSSGSLNDLASTFKRFVATC